MLLTDAVISAVDGVHPGKQDVIEKEIPTCWAVPGDLYVDRVLVKCLVPQILVEVEDAFDPPGCGPYCVYSE